MIGYKIAVNKRFNEERNRYVCMLCMVKLEIPKDAEVIRPYNSQKCRCDKAKVLSIRVLNYFNVSSDENVSEAESWLRPDKSIKYIVGDMVYADALDLDKNKECANGIHFFTKEEYAINFAVDKAVYNIPK